MEKNFSNNSYKKIHFNNSDNNEEIISTLNNISNLFKNFFISMNQITNNLKNISSTLVKQIISSNSLIKEIKKEKNYSIKFNQLNDRLVMLEDSRKLLEENIKIINYNLNYYSNDINKSFSKIQEYNNNKNIRFNNNLLNNRYEKKSPINSYNNSKNKNKNKNNINTNMDKLQLSKNINNFYSINCCSHRTSKFKSIFRKSTSSHDSSLNEKINYLSPQKINKKYFDFCLSHKPSRLNSTNNSYRSDFNTKSTKNLYQKNIFNSIINNSIHSNHNKISRNLNNDYLLKKTHSLSNLIKNKYENLNKDNKNQDIKNNYKSNNININSYNRNNSIRKKILNDNENINLNSNKNNNLNNDYSLLLSYKVIQFLSTINEMKTKFKNKNIENKLDFNKIKIKYESLKKTISDISNKIISNYYSITNTINSLNSNNTINNNKYVNNFDINELLSKIEIYKEKINNLENNYKNLSFIKENLLNEIKHKNIIISKTLKEVDKLKNQNNFKFNDINDMNNLNNELIDNLKIEMENYIIQIKELKFSIDSKNNEIIKKDKIIKNLNNELYNILIKKNKNKQLLKQNVVYFSFINNDITEMNNNINIIKEKEEIILLLKNEINSLKNKINGDLNNNSIIEEYNYNNNYINNNIYKINEYKEKIKKLNEENSNLENNYNLLLDENKSLNKEIEILSNRNLKNELIMEEQENKIKELNQKIEEDIYSKNKKNIELKESKEKVELLLNKNQELNNKIEDLKNNNELNLIDKENNNDIINDYKSKIKSLLEQNSNYKDENEGLKIENSIVQKEFENTKNENNKLNEIIKKYNIGKYNEEFTSENYDIISDKSYGNLNWFLLRKKLYDKNNYNDYIWKGKNEIKDLDEFNYINEIDLINKKINNYISQLEQKEDIISKLTYRLNKYENNDK